MKLIKIRNANNGGLWIFLIKIIRLAYFERDGLTIPSLIHFAICLFVLVCLRGNLSADRFVIFKRYGLYPYLSTLFRYVFFCRPLYPFPYARIENIRQIYCVRLYIEFEDFRDSFFLHFLSV